MKQKKVLPNIRTCELLFSLFGVVSAPYEDSNILSQVDAAKRINAIEKYMVTNGIQHSHLSIKNIVSFIDISFFTYLEGFLLFKSMNNLYM